MTSIFLMANGSATRFPGRCKHTVDIGGEPLIARTIRQLSSYPAPVYLVTHKPEIIAHANGCGIINPGPTRTLAESILSTEPKWTNRNIILLGDVVFTHQAISTIFSCDTLRFIGSDHRDRIKPQDERYALVFTKRDIPAVKDACNTLIAIREVYAYHHAGLKLLSRVMLGPITIRIYLLCIYPLLSMGLIPEEIAGRHIHDFFYYNFCMPEQNWKYRFMEVNDPMVEDLDTPEDYAAYLERMQ
jgi:hypothetical protein